MLIDIDKIVVGDRIRKDFGDIQELAEDIKENGLINPPVVNKEYVLLAGERRLRACKSLGWPQIEVRMMDTRDAEHELRIEITENELRKEFTWTERLEYARRLERIESINAKERMLAGKAINPTANLPQGETRNIVAAQLGTSATQLRKAQAIADNRDLLDPADFADWDEGRLSTNKAYQRIKAAKEQAERERNQARQELDAAQQDLADAWQAQEDAETEVVVLKRKLESIDKPKPEIVEREVESKAARKRISELEHERDLYLDNVQKLRKRNEDMRAELDKAKDILGMDKTAQDVRRDVQYLITATNSYVRRYGGLTWTVQQLGEVDEPTLEQLRKAVRNLATFSNALMTSLEDANE